MLSMIYGLMGRGKSHFALYYGLLIANKYEKKLVTNYLLNLDNVAHYCNWMGYSWLLNQLDKEGIIYMSLDSDAKELLSIPDSVILMDEAALYFPAREYRNTPKKLLADIVQMRKDKSYLICVSQAEFQIDKQIRGLQFEIFHAHGIFVYDKKFKSERLIYKSILRFDPDRYQQYLADPKIRKNPFKSRMVANKKWAGFLTAADKYLFECFDSFARLDHRDEEYINDYDRVIELSSTGNLKFVHSDEFYLVSMGKLPSLPCLSKMAVYLFKKTALINLAMKLSRFQLSRFEKSLVKGVYLLFATMQGIGGISCLFSGMGLSVQWLLFSAFLFYIRWIYQNLI